MPGAALPTTGLSFDPGTLQKNGLPSNMCVLAGFPSTITSGDYGSFSVTAYDAYGNGATGTVHFTSSDGSATLPADYTFTPSNYGTAYSFSATLRAAGTQSITATDTANSTITGSATITVSPPAAPPPRRGAEPWTQSVFTDSKSGQQVSLVDRLFASAR